MLPKSRRLNRQQFWQVDQQGRSVAGSDCVVKFIPNGLGYSRWAVVTSTKLDKRAVVRNRLRRKIYAAAGRVVLPADIIIFPRIAMLNLDDAKLNTAVDQVVSKISGLA